MNHYQPLGATYGAPCRWCGAELAAHQPLERYPWTPQAETIRPHYWCPTEETHMTTQITPEYTATWLADFEKLATRAIRRVNAMTPEASVQARRDLRGWKLNWTTSLLHKRGATSAEVRACWERATIAARTEETHS